jgi:Ni/Co efflux regulator RcnB
MRQALFHSIAIGCALVAMPAIAGTESAAAAKSMTSAGEAVQPHRWGQRVDGRWQAGTRAPGGWSAYHRPAYGYALPAYWMQPDFYIADFGGYDLPAPQSGYGWSRYYDDAVLTDAYGRVFAVRGDIAWDRHEGGYDDDAATAQAAPRPNGPPPPGLGGRPGQGEGYGGRWVGTWYGDDGRVYSGEYEGSYEGDVRGADAGPPPPYHGGAHWGPPPPPAYRDGPGPYREPGAPGVYRYETGPGTTTIVIQPGTITTVEEIVEDTSRRSYHRRPVKRCDCK